MMTLYYIISARFAVSDLDGGYMPSSPLLLKKFSEDCHVFKKVAIMTIQKKFYFIYLF